ncbi:MAG: hypothetical protein JWP12_1525 [Bacteroidetes bacterium]|nr:hypothetical protein [Bacteroidota bacterium]
MKKYLLLSLLSLQLLFGCKRQPTEFEKFDNLFEQLTADTLKISYIVDADNTLNDSLIIGKRIPVTFYHLFEFPQEFAADTAGYSSSIFVNAFKKIVFGNRVGYLVRFYNKETRVPNFICLYVYNSNTRKMSSPEIVQYVYGSEGTEALTDSWIFDLNKDGSKDLIQNIYECNLSGNDAEITHFVDTLTVKIWTDTAFKATCPDNYKQLKKQFKANCICSCGIKE